MRTAEPFSAFAAHYGFAFSLRNPRSGHEKGSVENKVGYIRRNLFVPIPFFDSGRRFNETLLARCMVLSGKPHWIKGEEERALLMEDAVALLSLPSTSFDVVRYERRRTDKLGRVRLEARRLYSTSPEFAPTEVVCAIRAREVAIADAGGAVVATHARAYGDAPSGTSNPASRLALLARKPGVWKSSRARAAVTGELRERMDGLARRARRAAAPDEERGGAERLGRHGSGGGDRARERRAHRRGGDARGRPRPGELAGSLR